MTDIFTTGMVCITVIVISAMAYNLLAKLLSGKFNSDIVRLEEDINGHAEDMKKIRGALQVEIMAIRERLGKMEMANSGRRHS